MMKNERLDELIDRVSASLVDVPDDVMLTARLRTTLGARRTQPWIRVMTLAAATVVIAVALGTWKRQQDTGETTPLPAVARLTTAALAAPLAPTFARSGATVGKPVGPVAVVARGKTVVDATPLSVAALHVAPLEVPEVTLDVLADVAGLAIADLDEEKKEPR